MVHPIPIGETVGERIQALQIAGQRRGKTDRYAILSNERQVWKPKEKEFTDLGAEIQSWYPDLAANATEIAIGNRFEVQIGARSIEKSWVGMAKVYKAAGGLKAFLGISTVTFKALSGILGIAAAEALQVEAQTGHRKLKAVARVAPAVELPPQIELPRAA